MEPLQCPEPTHPNETPIGDHFFTQGEGAHTFIVLMTLQK